MNTMIAAPVPARHGHTKKHGDCGCGGECESGCCELECLVHPNYFCGQLLDDTDLTSLVTWARSRLSLQRYRDGWGVVCGLDVECGHQDPCDKSHGPAVTVSPGYAIDCCGRDLVLCQPETVDLSGFCEPPDDPCADPPKRRKQDRQTGRREPAASKEPDCDDIWQIRREDAIRVNLFIQYAETMAGGTRTVYGAKCGDSSGCRYTRVQETPRIVPVLVEQGNADVVDPLTRWSQKFQKELGELSSRIFDGTIVPEALLRWLAEKDLHPTTFCFVVDYLRCVARMQAPPERWIERAGPWIIQDWILRQLRCGCAPCRTEDGVLLGQVCLARVDARSSNTGRVVYIADRPPHRRPLQRDCSLADTRLGGLAPYIGRRWDHTVDELDRRGFIVGQKDLASLSMTDIQRFYSSYRSTLSVKTPMVCHTLKDPCGITYIAGFAEAPRPPAEAPKSARRTA